MAMLQEFCTDRAHLEYPATPTEDGRQICPVCTGTRRLSDMESASRMGGYPQTDWLA